MSNIKLIRTQSNEEIIAEVVEETEQGISFKNPCVLGPTEKGLGFFPWMPLLNWMDSFFQRVKFVTL